MDEKIALDAANAVRLSLEASLKDVSARTVTIGRDEALLALGLVNAMIEMIGSDIARRDGAAGQ